MTVSPLDHLKVNWPALLIQLGSYLFIAISRIVAITVFISVFKPWVFLALGIHWLAMTIWLNTRKTNYTSGWWEERVLNILAGVVYLFVYIEIHDTDSRYHALAFHVLVLAENILFVGLWISYSSNLHYAGFVLSVVFVGFLIGIGLLAVYQKYCYPKKAFTFDKPIKPKIILDEALITCTKDKHYPNSKHCPILSTSNFQSSPKLVHKVQRGSTPPYLLVPPSAVPRCFPKLNFKRQDDSSPDAYPGEATPDVAAPIDTMFRAQPKIRSIADHFNALPAEASASSPTGHRKMEAAKTE